MTGKGEKKGFPYFFDDKHGSFNLKIQSSWVVFCWVARSRFRYRIFFGKFEPNFDQAIIYPTPLDRRSNSENFPAHNHKLSKP